MAVKFFQCSNKIYAFVRFFRPYKDIRNFTRIQIIHSVSPAYSLNDPDLGFTGTRKED